MRLPRIASSFSIVKMALLLILAVSFSIPAQASYSSQPVQSAEVVAVRDVTDGSCSIQRLEHKAENLSGSGPIVEGELVSESVSECPGGTVLETFPTTKAEASAQGIAFVVLSGDFAADREAVAKLESSLMPKPVPPDSDQLASCRSRVVTNNLSYGANGGTVYASVRYYQSTSCTWYLSYSSAYQYGVISSKHGWDRVLYNGGGQYFSWGQNCVSLKPDGTFRSNSYSGWWINLGGVYTTKSTNTDLVVDYGCAGWATTYSGSVYLWG